MSSNYYDQPTGSWNTKTHIYDSGLNSFEEAKAALYGLWLFLLVGIAICAAFVTKSRSALALSIFKPHKFWLAIALAIV